MHSFKLVISAKDFCLGGQVLLCRLKFNFQRLETARENPTRSGPRHWLEASHMPWKNQSELVDHLCDNIIFQDSKCHPGLAEIFVPIGVSGSDITETFRQ